jgi:hypothetical protein
LCGEESEGVECYSPDKLVSAREYLATQEAVELAEAEAKEQTRIEKAVNTLRNKQLREEKEARQAAAQTSQGPSACESHFSKCTTKIGKSSSSQG